METFVQSLTTETLTLAQAGGKGANLSRLIRAGLPVPPGVVITTAAYRRFVSANDLEPQIKRLSQSVAGPAAIEDASRKIRDLFAAAPMPEALQATIASVSQDFGESAVAVRSSATAEDLPEASFAGQQESYLNIRGQEGLLEAVRLCWSSLWTARAMAYRNDQSIPSDEISLAIVVQEMVEAETAGVLFTINPLTGDPDEMLVNATWGLGESLVAGRVNPDSLVLDKYSGVIKEQQLGDKTSMITPAANGTAEVDVPEDKRREATLTAVHATELASLCRQVETLFGGPRLQ